MNIFIEKYIKETDDYLYLAAVVAAVLFLTAAVLLLSFFTVTIRGAVEESDDVYELCGVRLLRYKKGTWTVSIGSSFDDNAVVVLGLGWIFRILFWNWNITAVSEGNKKGCLTAPVERNTKLYRRKVRRG